MEKILFTICGRKGSKGIKDKNTKDFCGYPLPYYSLSAVDLFRTYARDPAIDVVVNTDSEKLAQMMECNPFFPIDIIPREESLAGDFVPKISVIQDCFDKMQKKKDTAYDIVVDLDITSPMRTVYDIQKLIDTHIKTSADVTTSVTGSRRNPYFNMVRRGKKGFERVIGSDLTARQQAPEIYDLNASLYAYAPGFLKTGKGILDGYCECIYMYDTGILDLDREDDLELMQVIAGYLFHTKTGFREIRENIKMKQKNQDVDNTNNKQYWDDYVSYWEDKVDEANNDRDAVDKTNDDLLLETYLRKLDIQEGDRLLDYGCGFGRAYPVYEQMGYEKNNYFGIDVSRRSLEHAQMRHDGLMLDANLKEFDGLSIPFADGYFEKIICFGVFDACRQETVIQELFRVLKTGGLLLLTGKNNRYFKDDGEAINAENNARKKGHPNYFTDVHSLLRQLKKNGIEITDSYYFLRRGDFPSNKFLKEMPDVFYEYALILKKGIDTREVDYQSFSSKYSSTLSGQNISLDQIDR